MTKHYNSLLLPTSFAEMGTIPTHVVGALDIKFFTLIQRHGKTRSATLHKMDCRSSSLSSPLINILTESFYYFLAMQMMAGLFQSSGWPSVVAVVGNWFGKSKRGLIMGIWNAHTSVGNISGSLIAAAMLKYGWSWSFAVPGIMIALVGLTVFLLLRVSPDVIGIQEDLRWKDSEKAGMDTPLLEPRSQAKEKAVGFIEAWRIPGVAPFALCLFFCKLVAYTFLYWLPFYISHTAIGVLSTLFDVGGVVGGILAGHISDRLDARALTTASFTFSAIPALFFYRIYGSVSLTWNM